MRRNFLRILTWLCVSGGFWLGGGLAEGGARLACWAAALAIEYAAPSLGFYVPGLGRSTTREWDVEGGHLAERCALFVIIALGESVLVTGATFAELEWTGETVAAFLVSLAGSVAMWWTYFGVTAEAGSEKISHSADPGRLARLAYTYIHLFLVGGIIVLAVSDEFVLHHPAGHAEGAVVLTVLGGTALFLIGNALFQWAITGRVFKTYLAVAAVLGAAGWFGRDLSPLALSGMSTILLTLLAVVTARDARHA